MKNVFLVAALFLFLGSAGQCPYTVNLTSSGECPGATLTVGASKNLSKIVWTKDGVPVSTVTAVSSYNPIGVTVAGGNGAGSGANQLNFPQGIYVDAAGDVLVADANNNRVQAWAVGVSSGITVVSNYGVGTDQLNSVVDAFPDGYGNIYVSDYGNYRVQLWTGFGATGTTIAGGNGSGSAANQLDFPVGIFLDPNGNLYIADINNNRVQKWASGATTGVTVAGGNGAGSGANQLQFPAAVFVDGSGNLYIADDGNNRIQKWAPGAASGVTVAGGNGAGSGANQLNSPYGVYVDGNGNIFVADAVNNRIQEWAPGATTGITVAGGNDAGAAANQLNDPRSVWMDANANLYVSEDQNNRVQKFTLQTTINNTYIAPSPGVYTAVATYATGCTAPSNPITILGPLTPSVSITASANPVNLCTQVSFTAAPAGAGSSPSYQWQVNGVNAVVSGTTTGATGPVFSTGSLKDGDVVTCVITSNDVCISSAPVSSNPIRIGVNALPQANMISRNTFCPGDTLAITSGDSLAQIVWSDNGSPVSTATATPVGAAITVAGGNGPGLGANQLYDPTDVVVDAAGNVYVADYSNHRVQKWAPGAASGISVAGVGGVQLEDPSQIVVDAAGNLYVTDVLDALVFEYAPGSSQPIVVAGGHGIGSDANQLNAPVAIFVDGAGNLYVADGNNYRVQKWAPGASSGVTVAGGNGAGFANNQVVPGSIFVDKAGNLYISDGGTDRIQEWAPGATSGVTILGPPALNYIPGSIYVDNAGNLYVVDSRDASVWKYAPGSTTGVVVAGGNGIGDAANQLGGGAAVFVDAKGDIYVADVVNNRVQEYLQHPLIDTVYKTLTPGTYTASVTTSGGCVLGTNSIIVNPSVSPGVSVAASATTVCAGAPVTFTATPANGGTAPVYQWQVNGTDAGSNSPVFTTSLAAGAPGAPGSFSIVCRMTGNADCALQPSAVASPVVLTVNPDLTPSISINASSTNICSGAKADFIATTVNGGTGPSFQWTVDGVPAGTSSPDFSSTSLVNGDVVTCVLGSNAVCATAATAPSNSIVMQVNSTVAPTISIAASADPVCSGTAVTFSATATTGSVVQNYQWQVNGVNAGINSPVYTTADLVNGAEISCLFSTDNVCAAATSNSIVMTVNPTPVIAPGQVFTGTPQGVQLEPKVSGDIAEYTWSPATDLSGTSIPDPVADPQTTTVYTLTVVSADGCSASGEITVKVYTQLRIPNAFTPNGDGHNDVFYILGGPAGSMIKDFMVFDRWGQKVFQVHGVPSGDPAFGWHGDIKGVPATPGAYVYLLNMTLAGGIEQVYKGVVMLIR